MTLTISPQMRVVAALGGVAALGLAAFMLTMGRPSGAGQASMAPIKPLHPVRKPGTHGALRTTAAAKPKNATPKPVVLLPGLPTEVATALLTHELVVVSLYDPQARVAPDVAAASDGMVFYRKRGCPRCNQTGYRGRVGIYQLLQMSETLESLAVQKASREEIERAAIAEGMRTLWDDGIAKVAAGLTSIEELARVSV